MEDYQIDILIGQGRSQVQQKLPLKPFTLIERRPVPDFLPRPCAVFRQSFRLDFYSVVNFQRKFLNDPPPFWSLRKTTGLAR